MQDDFDEKQQGSGQEDDASGGMETGSAEDLEEDAAGEEFKYGGIGEELDDGAWGKTDVNSDGDDRDSRTVRAAREAIRLGKRRRSVTTR